MANKKIIAIMAAGSEKSAYEFYRSYLNKADYIIAADGGLCVLYHLHILPNLLVGDGDSTPDSLWAWALENHIPTQRFPVEKNATDTEIALDIAISHHPDLVWILGGIGSRLDHTLGNLYLLEYAHLQHIEAMLISHNHEVYLLSNQKPLILNGIKENIFSILPITENLEGLTLEGFHWNLQNTNITRYHTLTISNRLETFPNQAVQNTFSNHNSLSNQAVQNTFSNTGKISVQKGLAWVIKTYEPG